MPKSLKIIGVVAIIIVGIMGITCKYSMGIIHLIHLAIPPIDLYDSIVLDDFDLSAKNYMKKYDLNPKYVDCYEVGVLDEAGNIPLNYKFKGAIEIKLYYKNELISVETIDKATAYGYSKNNNYIRTIAFKTFPIPIKGIDLNNISIDVKVIEPDNSISKPVKLYIAVSPTP